MVTSVVTHGDTAFVEHTKHCVETSGKTEVTRVVTRGNTCSNGNTSYLSTQHKLGIHCHKK